MGEKFLQLQQQMRHDNEDLQDYLRDLKNWERDIKRKDEALRQEKAQGDPVLPPIRNQSKRKSKETRRKSPKSTTKQPPPKQHAQNDSSRIRAYDYRSWDKFDVDKACAQLDSDEDGEAETTSGGGSGGMSSGTDSEEERELDRQQLIQQANMEKDKGNALFKEGRYDDAVVCYSAGIDADPANAILPANRAMARLKLKRFEDAERDCDSSIALDCTYIKAYARRGAARSGLGKLAEAKKDYQQVLNLEPSNKQAVLEIKRIDRILKEREDTERQKQDGVYNIIQAVQKPVHLRSKKPLRRMVIEEIGTGNGNDEDDSPNTTAPHKPLDMTPSNHSLDSGHPLVPGTAIQHQMEISTPNQRIREAKDPESEVRAPDPTRTPLPPTDSPVQTKTGPPPSLPTAPSSSYQLQADWKKLQRFPNELFQYFKRIPPESYKQLLQQSLDSTLLMRILTLLKDQYIGHDEPVYETMEGLTRVKRFEMNVMFMSARDKEVVQALFSYMEQSGTKDRQELSKLRKQYQL